jgi:hypothetical protein
VALDLNRSLDAALESPIDLVTTSAVARSRFRDMARTPCGDARRPINSFYAALSYDGRIDLTPHDPEDAALLRRSMHISVPTRVSGRRSVPLRQAFAVTRFQSLGFSLVHGTSDWLIEPNDREMQSQVLSGWAGAAVDTGGLIVAVVDAWLARRRDAVAAGLSSIRVGHVDVFAAPIRTR